MVEITSRRNSRQSVPSLFFPGLLLLAVIAYSGCRRSNTPKPRGYFRIDFPEKQYIPYHDSCPYTFEYPVYGKIEPDIDYLSEPCWINIEFPEYLGKIHISYKPVSNNIRTLLEDSHTLAYKHSIKAQSINERLFLDDEARVYGMMYDITGDAASAVQFYLTDSVHHFIRGALYFTLQPNSDSLLPVIEFFREDIVHLIETLEWQDL
ncbi:MAG: gliding motility lipoprotein GldD [Bacteroidales bacterium]|nr:MAG: gliding motility lipoprotein GldD [Bacteroidales bacterium]